jgi:hypothetical protein
MLNKEIYIQSLTFLSPENFILIVLSTGDIHLAHPSKGEMIQVNFNKTVPLAFKACNLSQDALFFVSEQGLAETFAVSFRNSNKLQASTVVRGSLRRTSILKKDID